MAFTRRAIARDEPPICRITLRGSYVMNKRKEGGTVVAGNSGNWNESARDEVNRRATQMTAHGCNSGICK